MITQIARVTGLPALANYKIQKAVKIMRKKLRLFYI
jgi:hypothetical protein